MYTIKKSYQFDFGHRVYSQRLDPLLTDSLPVCRFLHGHRGTVQVSLQSETLIDDMVTDFKHLDVFKKFLNRFDHRFFLSLNDPLVSILKDTFSLKIIAPSDSFKYFVFDSEAQNVPRALREFIDSFILVDFVPTAERFSEFLFDYFMVNVVPYLPKGVHLKSITFYETPTAAATYTDN